MTALHRHPGRREEKITILMPKSLAEDLRALRLVTGQSTGDLVNQLLESHVEQARADVEAGRAMLRIRESRQRAGAAGIGADAQPEPEPEPEPAKEPEGMPDDAFIDAVDAAAKPSMQGRIRNRSKEYREWCQAHGAGFASHESMEEFLTSKYSGEEAIKKNRAAIRAVIDAWRDAASG